MTTVLSLKKFHWLSEFSPVLTMFPALQFYTQCLPPTPEKAEVPLYSQQNENLPALQSPIFFSPESCYSYCPILTVQHSNLKSAFNRIGNLKRPRGEKKTIPNEQKDDKYYERRKRNNQAAKKSRDARRLREDQVALRASILEHENAVLRAQVLALKEEAYSLRQLLIHHKNWNP